MRKGVWEEGYIHERIVGRGEKPELRPGFRSRVGCVLAVPSDTSLPLPESCPTGVMWTGTKTGLHRAENTAGMTHGTVLLFCQRYELQRVSSRSWFPCYTPFRWHEPPGGEMEVKRSSELGARAPEVGTGPGNEPVLRSFPSHVKGKVEGKPRRSEDETSLNAEPGPASAPTGNCCSATCLTAGAGRGDSLPRLRCMRRARWDAEVTRPAAHSSSV